MSFVVVNENESDRERKRLPAKNIQISFIRLLTIDVFNSKKHTGMKASNFYPSASARSIRDILKYFEPPLVTIFFNFLNQKAVFKPIYNGISKQIFLCKELRCAHAVTVSILQVGGFMLYTNFLWRHFEKLYITFLSSASHFLQEIATAA